MGKTPKKAAPGGDERNLYVRRQKATTATSKASESSSSERQRESESSNRPKLTGIQKRISAAQGKNLKVTPGALGKPGLNHRRVGKPPIHPSQNKIVPSIVSKSMKEKATDMQPESDDMGVNSKVSIQKDSSKQLTISQDTLDGMEHVVKENFKPDVESKQENKVVAQMEPVVPHEEKNGNDHQTGQIRESEESEETDLKLSFEADDSPTKSIEKDTQNENKTPVPQVAEEEIKNGTCEQESTQNGSRTDTENCPVAVVGSTASESSKAAEVVLPSDPEKHKVNDAAKTDTVTYDSSITLKDVQIQLNDCLKEGSHPPGSVEEELNETTPEDASATPINQSKDASFGRTLRNISGRHSLSRMRYVTLRDRSRLSPNNSLFVNTSNTSLQPGDTEDVKLSRYHTGLPDALSTNGTPAERKRKLDSESSSASKKQKTEAENSLLHTSINLLKGLRRPVQVSTPNPENHKVHSAKFDLSAMDDQDEPPIITGEVGVKKWCVIM